MFTKNKLSIAVVGVLAASAVMPALAQNDNIEEVFVTGMRASLEAAMDIKRNAAGVVDAISAEDIGKFPDSNLAESLQRITGVSISRVNGEGAEITVRGFGGEYNMVTLNGRTMPGASVYGGGSGAGGTWGGSTRAFDFSNLASESVSGVEVYKTGKASIATGGIGATVNVKTAKPLDNPGLNASFGAKALSDSTNRTGSDITPELSGVVSWADDTETFGIAVSGSYQERDSGSTGASENAWNIGVWGEDNLYSFTDDAVIVNAPQDGQLYGRPNDIRYVFSDTQRTRTNAHVALQWAPSEAITTSLDYTFAENEILERRGESTSWLANGNSIDRVEFDTGSVVAAPLYIHETAGPRDQGYEQQLRQQVNTLSSVGFNVDWAVSDRLTLNFDLHNSSMESLPNGPGNSGEIAASLGAPVQTSHWLDFSGDMPLYDFEINDGIQGTSTVRDPSSPDFAPTNYQDADGNDIRYPNWVEAWTVDAADPAVQVFTNGETTDTATAVYRGNNNGELDAGDIGSQVVRVFYAAQTTDLTQMKLDGSFEFDNGRFDFGVESRSMEMTQQASDRYMGMGDWGIANVGDVPVELFEEYNLSDFEDYDASASMQRGFKGNAEDIAQSLVDTYGTADNGYVVAYNPNFSQNNVVKEDINAVYVEVALEGSLGDMPTNILAGLRYESTEVTSSTDMLVPTHLRWLDNNDFNTQRQSDATRLDAVESYDNLLPSLDFDIAITDAIKARASFSQTIARTTFSNLSPAASNFASGGGSVYNGAQPTANLGNPGLLPLESNNFDLSAEWYFDDTSYVSAGVFEKRVKNFVGTEQTNRTLSEFGVIQDVTSGPRVQRAAQALQDEGIALDDTSLFVMTAILDNPTAFPNGAADYASAVAEEVAFTYDIDAVTTGADMDPETVWQISSPINNREAKLYGAEFAVQHFFGESGFGVQANYTVVNGDISYDNGAHPSESQFALLGLSDTANIVGMYEKDGLQARIAYNWRDQYLDDASRNSSRNPVYIEAYSQIDLNVSYDVTDELVVFAEGLNITGENSRSHQRNVHMIEELYDLGARYTVGARYSF
ncbi:TonB-dependent receptor [Teredinibacter purpureus]|nr:TonB-dependent receptor [Teredinibacter purpureus]